MGGFFFSGMGAGDALGVGVGGGGFFGFLLRICGGGGEEEEGVGAGFFLDK